MNVDKDTRVIILPKTEKGHQFYKIINLPLPSDLTKLKSYLIYENDNKIYELNIIKGDNSSVTLKNGDAVKSIIIESTTGNGGVLQSANILIGSPFNFTYLLISLFEKHYKQINVFKTVEDIRDSLVSLENDWIYDINSEVFTNSLSAICDEIEENETKFFKYSNEKCIEWINSKILNLQKYIQSSNNNSILSKIKSELNDSTQINYIIDENLINEMSLLYSIDYICDSYLPQLKQQIISHYNYNFFKMETHLSELKQKQKNLEVIESNMNEINMITANANAANKKKKQPPKKQVKKVAIGKGALDGFLKKA
ncbi:hypothetical protein KGF54_003465 [Candida jiufengensis]|uniref:uncharacterized protein n=1 Tax=Candida jiufengensis TaxID=497108 RepID=UPI002224DCA2|nr:uncharacterized protein KGF54_003465 [Candida jiufengensis]KAI5952598.1 hypothetical protein KGF54_003465 [Candida jiufengensis]